MELKFIGQGLDPTNDSTAGNLIIDSLVEEQFHSFNAFVAFVSIGGIIIIELNTEAFAMPESCDRTLIRDKLP